jgi:hypothetical protein
MYLILKMKKKQYLYLIFIKNCLKNIGNEVKKEIINFFILLIYINKEYLK